MRVGLYLPPGLPKITQPTALHLVRVTGDPWAKAVDNDHGSAEDYRRWIFDGLKGAFPKLVVVESPAEIAALRPRLIIEVELVQRLKPKGGSEDQLDVRVLAIDDRVLFSESQKGEGVRFSVHSYTDALWDELQPLVWMMLGDEKITAYLRSTERPPIAARFQPNPPQTAAKQPPKPVKVTTSSAGRTVIAVFAVEGVAAPVEEPALDRFRRYLSARFASTGQYEVVPIDRMRELISEEKRASYDSCFDESCQIELGRELAAQKTIATQIMKLGTKCTTTLSLYDLRKATLERAATSNGPCEDAAIATAIDDAVRTLAK